MKALLVTNKIKQYALGFQVVIEALLASGYEVTWAGNFTYFKGDIGTIPCITYQVDLDSNPFAKYNLRAIKQLNTLMKSEKFDLVQCSTPIGGLIGRLLANKNQLRPVVYAVHGFHFYKGGNRLKNFIFEAGERFMGRYTDILVTICEEDFNASKRIRLRGAGQRIMVHGAGIKTGYQSTADRKKLREELGIPLDAFLLISAGELNRNKNNEIIIRAIAQLADERVHYLICGEGHLEGALKTLAEELSISCQIHFAGFRSDVLDLMSISDCFTMPSFREGLPRALMEAMDIGLPCIVSNTRGNRDLIQDGVGGIVCDCENIEEFVSGIQRLLEKDVCKEMGSVNKRKVEKYNVQNVKKEYLKFYYSIKSLVANVRD